MRLPCSIAILTLLLAAGPWAVRSGHAQAPVPPPDDSTAVGAGAPEPAPAPAPGAGVYAAPAGPALFADVPDTSGRALPQLVEVRLPAAIDSERQEARGQREAATRAVATARDREQRWQAQVEIEKSQIEVVKRRFDLARREKRADDARALDERRRRLEQVRSYLERVVETYRAEQKFRQAAIDYADARLRACDVEWRLAELWGAEDPAVRRTRASQELEQRALEAIQERARKLEDAATREQGWTSRRREVLEAWQRLNG